MRAEAFQVLRRKPVQVSKFLLTVITFFLTYTLITFSNALCLQWVSFPSKHELFVIEVNLVLLLGTGILQCRQLNDGP